MSISMRLSCNVPRNGCLPRFLRTHGDMNEAMSHASMKGNSRETHKVAGWCSCARDPRGSFQAMGLCASHMCRGLPGTEHPEAALSVQTRMAGRCVHQVMALPDDDWLCLRH